MSPFYKNTRRGFFPRLKSFAPALLGRHFSFLAGLSLLCALLIFPFNYSKAQQTIVKWGTADYDMLDAYFGGGFAVANPLEFYGLDADGTNPLKLGKDLYDSGTAHQVNTKGDLVELGYFASDAAGTPSAISSDLFKGNYWIPLTSTTRIGMQTEGPDP